MSAAHEIDDAVDREEQLEQRRAARAEARRGPAFEIVDELPPSTRGIGRQIPQARIDLAETARSNPGRWVKYTPGDREAIKKVAATLQTACRKHQQPFPDREFQGVMRGGFFYLRWTPADDGDAA